MSVYAPRGITHSLETLGAWVLGVLWVLPLVYAFCDNEGVSGRSHRTNVSSFGS